MSKLIQDERIVSNEQSGKRLDQIAASLFSDYSRARIQQWIKSAEITVDGQVRRAKDKLLGGETITLNAQLQDEQRWQPQDIVIDEIYSDEHIIVLNKPAGLTVHPGAGTPDGTLLNGLLYHYPELSLLPRAGIVHRLDKDTTGLMVVARSLEAQTGLVDQLQDRSLGREYEAIVMGELTGGGMIDKPIGRHPTQRIKMAVIDNAAGSQVAKDAVTHYRLIKRFKGYTHIVCQLETGRTHQIRVHLAYRKHPLIGDPVYLNRQPWVAGSSAALKSALQLFSRQALHAKKLGLVHPCSGEYMEWECDLPDDMQVLLTALHNEA